jgi:hypothetical protein
MIIILLPIAGYKITDVFSLYAQDVMGYDAILQSAQIGALFVRVRLRRLGVLADRTQTTLC